MQLLPFEEVFAEESAGNIKTPQSEYKATGLFPVVDQGKALIAGYVDDAASVCGEGRPAIVFGDHTRAIKFVDFPFCMGADGVKVLRPKIGADLKYLYHFLRQLKLPDGGYDRHFKYLKRSEVALPSLPEQRRIAAILDQADALRTKRQESLEQLNGLAQSIFLEMFGDSQAEQMTIGHLFATGTLLLHKDGNHGSQYPSADDFGDCGVPFLSAKSVDDDGEIDEEQVQRLRTEKAQKLRIGWIERDDVLLAHNASVGKVALYDGRFESALIGTSLTAYRPNPARLDSRFLTAALRSSFFQRQLEKNMGQTTRNQVPITAQRGLTLPLPDIVVQREFAKKAEQVEQQRRLSRAAARELEAMYVSLQARAFRGKV